MPRDYASYGRGEGEANAPSELPEPKSPSKAALHRYCICCQVKERAAQEDARRAAGLPPLDDVNDKGECRPKPVISKLQLNRLVYSRHAREWPRWQRQAALWMEEVARREGREGAREGGRGRHGARGRPGDGPLPPQARPATDRRESNFSSSATTMSMPEETEEEEQEEQEEKQEEDAAMVVKDGAALGAGGGGYEAVTALPPDSSAVSVTSALAMQQRRPNTAPSPGFRSRRQPQQQQQVAYSYQQHGIAQEQQQQHHYYHQQQHQQQTIMPAPPRARWRPNTAGASPTSKNATLLAPKQSRALHWGQFGQQWLPPPTPTMSNRALARYQKKAKSLEDMHKAYAKRKAASKNSSSSSSSSSSSKGPRGLPPGERAARQSTFFELLLPPPPKPARLPSRAAWSSDFRWKAGKGWGRRARTPNAALDRKGRGQRHQKMLAQSPPLQSWVG